MAACLAVNATSRQPMERCSVNSSNASGALADGFSASELLFYFWFYKVAIPTLYSVIAVVGTVGNLMVIFVICSRRAMRTTVNVLLLNLACSDLLFLVVCVPFVAYHFAADDWAFGDLMCKLSQFLLYVTVYVTMYTLLLVAVVRYLTIVYPRSSARWRTRRVVCCTVGVIWGVMLLINVPTLLIYRVKSFPPGNAACVYSYCGVESAAVGRRLFVPFFVFTYVLPLAVITTLYLLVLRYLRESSRSSAGHLKARRGTTTSVTHIEERTLHATRILVVVVVVFAVCWLPLHVHLLVVYFSRQPASQAFEVYRGLSHCLAYANSAMNPVIYNYVSRDFRSSFRRLCSSCCGAWRRGWPPQSTAEFVVGGGGGGTVPPERVALRRLSPADDAGVTLPDGCVTRPTVLSLTRAQPATGEDD